MSITIDDLKTVYRITFEARNEWKDILLELGVSSATIDSIASKCRDNPKDCYREGLKEWLEGGERNWGDLVEALSSPTVDHKGIAMAIENKLQSPETNSITWRTPSTSDDACPSPCQKINEHLVIFPNEGIGSGAFGVVFKGSYRDRPCAVKVLHQVAMQIQTNLPAGQENETTALAFNRECEFLKSIQHPNVVQHLSTDKHPMSGSTILTTELMDCNLRFYLASLSKKSLTRDCQISLSKDVASGLAYIHSRKIIHRDLCGDNILLTLTQPVPIAKISDFGMSRLLDHSQMSHTLSAVGHRMGYLPPEALRLEGEQYNHSLDVFSLGVIMVQIVLKLETVKTVKDRSYYVSQIPTSHKLRHVISYCLQEDMQRRPTARDIYSKMKRELDHRGKVHSRDHTRTAPPKQEKEDLTLRAEFPEADGHLFGVTLQKGKHRMGLNIVANDDSQSIHGIVIIRIQQGGAGDQSGCVKWGDIILKVNDTRVIGMSRQEVQELLTKAPPTVRLVLLRQHMAEGEGRTQQKGKGDLSQETGLPLILNHKRGRTMPIKMGGPVQSVVIDTTVYVGGGNANNAIENYDNCTIMKFNLWRHEWTKLPLYKASSFAMTSLNNQLVLVGGMNLMDWKLCDEIAVFESGKWIHPHPPMNIARHSSTAVSFNNYIVVAGGWDDYGHTASVEVLDVASRRCFIAESLPYPRFELKSTLIGNTLYLMGGWDHSSLTKMVHKVDLDQLIAKTISEQVQATPTLWQTIDKKVPLCFSAPLGVGEDLLAVGGCDRNFKPTASSSIYLYQPDTRRWVKVGDLPKARYNCTCSVLPSGEVIVAGGQASGGFIDTVTLLTLK